MSLEEQWLTRYSKNLLQMIEIWLLRLHKVIFAGANYNSLIASLKYTPEIVTDMIRVAY